MTKKINGGIKTVPKLYESENQEILYPIKLDFHTIEDQYIIHINYESCWALDENGLKWVQKFLNINCRKRALTEDYWAVNKRILSILRRIGPFVHFLVAEKPPTIAISELEALAEAADELL